MQRSVLVVVFFLMLVTGLTGVSASFVCGWVNASLVEQSPAWMQVQVAYSTQITKNTTCKISPENNKYCCDLLAISGVSWGVGKNVSAWMNEQGGMYFAPGVIGKTSGNGYDVMPDLMLHKAINIDAPNQSISNQSNISFLISLSAPYVSLRYDLVGPENKSDEVCTNCTIAEVSIENLSKGAYEISFYAGNGTGEIQKNYSFSLVDYIIFSRSYTCEGCTNKKVPSGVQVQVQIQVNSSHPIKGSLIDYYPVSWILESEVTHGVLSESSNFVSFEVTGSNFSRNYTLVTPTTFISKKYYFESALDSFSSLPYPVTVSRFRILDYVAWPYSLSFKPSAPLVFTRQVTAGPEEPIVTTLNSSVITLIAIYPKEKVDDAHIFIQKYTPFALDKSAGEVSVLTNLNSSQEVVFSFKIPQSKLSRRIFEIYRFDQGTWNSLPAHFEKNESGYSYYQVTSFDTGSFAWRYVKQGGLWPW